MKFSKIYSYEEISKIVFKDFKDIFQEVDCLGLDEYTKNFNFPRSETERLNENKVNQFINKPIVISKLSYEEKFKTKAELVMILKNQEIKRKKQKFENSSKNHPKTPEDLLFERLDKTLLLIKHLSNSVEFIRSQNNRHSKEYAIKETARTCANLLNSIFILRHTSLIDYATISKAEYDCLLKFNLANNIYSIAVETLIGLKESLQ